MRAKIPSVRSIRWLMTHTRHRLRIHGHELGRMKQVGDAKVVATCRYCREQFHGDVVKGGGVWIGVESAGASMNCPNAFSRSLQEARHQAFYQFQTLGHTLAECDGPRAMSVRYRCKCGVTCVADLIGKNFKPRGTWPKHSGTPAAKEVENVAGQT